MKTKRNIAVVGAGYWGRNLVRVYHEIGALKAVCDSSQERQKYFLEKYPDLRRAQ